MCLVYKQVKHANTHADAYVYTYTHTRGKCYAEAEQVGAANNCPACHQPSAHAQPSHQRTTERAQWRTATAAERQATGGGTEDIARQEAPRQRARQRLQRCSHLLTK